ncbi:E3 ubiquitin-protein ligase ATL41-like [Fagus crenata]
MVDELQIAMLRAELLDTLSNWGHYSTYDGSYDPRTYSGKLDTLELQRIRLDTMTSELALSRAHETKRDFETVMMEVELEVTKWLGMILAKTMDPVFVGSMEVVIEEDGVVCGVCQEEMEVGNEGRMLGCMHKFHCYCIVKWLRNNATCPLCRYKVQFKEFELKI